MVRMHVQEGTWGRWREGWGGGGCSHKTVHPEITIVEEKSSCGLEPRPTSLPAKHLSTLTNRWTSHFHVLIILGRYSLGKVII